ncbi:MAG TPA: tetratricopeptide repeat protein [Anaerolineales bacterium]|nr:tetratricopeptide repeat protein [Anaerolineales bacterium]
MHSNVSPGDLSQEGQKAYQNEDFETAARAFAAAVEGYRAQGAGLDAAEQANNLAVTYLQLGRAAEALEAVESTPEIFAAAGDQRRLAFAYGNLGSALEALGNNEESLAAYQESADLLKALGEDKLRLEVMQSISGVQLKSGRQLEALATMKHGIEDVQQPSLQQKFLKRLLNVPFKYLGDK